MEALEAVIRFLSPEWALKRERARAQVAILENHTRGYEGAAKTRRTQGWRTADSDANKEIGAALSALRARSRDLVRNNGYIKKAVGAIVSNTIGSGIVPTFRGGANRRAENLRTLWRSWAETTACDVNGQNNFSGLQALAMRSIVESGEVLIRKVWTAKAEFPLSLQVIEADHIDHTKECKNIVQGVEFDDSGRRVAYWIFPKHPGAGDSVTSIRLKAEDILHVYRVDRPGQVRGVPWTAAAVLNIRDLDEYEDAELMRRKVASCFAGFVVDSEPADLAGKSDAISERLEPGLLEILPPGKDVRFATPPSVTGYSEYVAAMLRKVAAGLEVPFEVLTGDLSMVNFSSARMGWLEFQRSIDLWRWQMLVPRLIEPVWQWFAFAADLKGVRTQDISAEWTAPRREMIDPSKEIDATVTAVRAGLLSLSEAIRQFGYDPQLVLEEIAQTNKDLDAKALILDSDPRKTSRNGNEKGKTNEN